MVGFASRSCLAFSSASKAAICLSILLINSSISFSSISDVTFYDLTESEINSYLEKDEYKDKAGAYAIQGKASLFVKSIKGDYNSIVGLPVAQLNRVLKDFFNI